MTEGPASRPTSRAPRTRDYVDLRGSKPGSADCRVYNEFGSARVATAAGRAWPPSHTRRAGRPGDSNAASHHELRRPQKAESDVKEADVMMRDVGRSRRVSATGAPESPAMSRGFHLVGSPPGAPTHSHHAGPSVPQPGHNAARLRHRAPATAVVAWPTATGLLIGVVAVLLVRWNSGDESALIVGAIVGLLAYITHALMLYLVHAARQDGLGRATAPRSRYESRLDG